MSTTGKSIVLTVLFICVALFTFYLLESPIPEVQRFERIRSASSPKVSTEMKKDLWEYYHKMLRDPATNRIPDGIRSKELAFAKRLNEENRLLKKSSSSNISWQEAGPHDVGGRTRGLAVDIINPNVILAGGVSGGIWKSTDKGATWVLKSAITTILSVTTIAQDPRPGQTNVWYYGSGEFTGNSARDRGSRALFSGDGIYKSVDNGETWQVLPSTVTSDPTRWTSNFDYVLNIKVSPTTGSVFVASNGVGIFRSTDGGNSFSSVLGGVNQHIYSDIAVGPDGSLLAVLSSPFQGFTPTNPPGVYKSSDNGTTWTNITPAGYPEVSLRGVVAIAPSNPNTGYLLLHTGGTVNDREEIKFYKLDIGDGTGEDRSQNLPDFTSLGGIAQQVGFLDTQGGYDMIVAVKPDDEDFVLIGGTSIFRSTDGFATNPIDARTAWIGGYHNQSFFYPNFHPDVHSYSFDPTDPKKVWWGHDGGLSYTADITNTAYATYFPWENMNNGYNVTQFYHITISQTAGDTRIMGGTQDNGTPYFRFDGNIEGQIDDVSSGDGAFAYFGQNFAYTSSQNGNATRLNYDQQNNPSWGAGWTNITPAGAQNMLFINPFTVDPNNENVMYYLAGNVIWRNNQLGSIPVGNTPTSVGWTRLDDLTVPGGYGISTLAISRTPQHILYYAASSFSGSPLLYKLDNATTATSGAVDISIPEVQQGAYIHHIAINPDDANEFLVVISNYNVVSLYHTVNGGQSYTIVEGNLAGTQQNPGPSVRAASILPSGGGILYLVATSVGVFSTNQLNGDNTVWVQEGWEAMGNVVVNYIVSRKSDGKIVAGTHGRGAFVGNAAPAGTAILHIAANEMELEVHPGQTKNAAFRINNTGTGTLSFSITASGGETVVSKDRVPRLDKSELTLDRVIKHDLKSNIAGITQLIPNENRPDVISKPADPLSTEELILDDGDNFADGFIGIGSGNYFYWRNDFRLDKDFALEKIRFFMSTESINSNQIQILVAGNDGTFIVDTTVTFDLSSIGKWYEFQFPPYMLSRLQFRNQEMFSVIIGALNVDLNFPAGYDIDGLKPGNSHYGYFYFVFSWIFSGWVNFNTLTPNGAFLIRAVGNTGGDTQNQPPVAVAQVSPISVGVNQSVTFNGAGSYDPDGQITNFLWQFGDGQSSSQMNTTHSYSQAGQFTYTLTVTDNNGATGQTSGQVTVSDGPVRWTVDPSSGTVQAGSFQDIIISFNSEGLSEGNYKGELQVTSNGGNSVIPVNITISTTVGVDESPALVNYYNLEQNYPNPFNPSTNIRWQMASDNMVTLTVYDITGKEVAMLVDERREAGIHEITFNASHLPSGVYLYRLRAGEFTETKKLTLVK
jgi:PKD repeat protein